MELNIKPTYKQGIALTHLLDKTSEFTCFGGGAGGGKSWIGCEWLIMMSLSYTGTRWFIGRKELKQLKSTTLVTFFKVCSKHALKKDIHYRYNDNTSIITFTNGSTISLLDLAYKPSDPMYEDLGSSEYTGGWIEEGGEVNFEAFDTLKSRIGRCLNDKYNLLAKILITCNPKKNWLYNIFYKPQKEGKLPSNYIFIQSLVTDNTEIEAGYIDKLKSITDKSKKERLLYGNWEYDDDPSVLIDYDAIQDAFTNDYVEEGKGYITCDVARFGIDNTVIIRWSGLRAEQIITLKKSSISDTVEKINELAYEYSISKSNILVDEDGVGGGCKDFLKCKGFVNNSRPLPIKGETENYSNLKTQCYYRLANRINNGELFINCEDSFVKTSIIEELEQVRRKDMDKENKLAIIPKDVVKEKLGRSPDYSDALMMREWFDLQPNGRVVIF